MKKYIFLFFAIVTSGLFTSCNDQLDLQNDGRIDASSIFTDRYRTMGYLNACYGYCSGPYIDRASYCDEAEDCDDNIAGARSGWYNGSVTASNYASYSQDGGPWTSLYAGIRKCNVFLANIWNSTAYATDEEKEGWAAQAHTLRALYYLQLIKRYGDVPIYDKPLSVNYDYSKLTKAKFSAVVKFILADCDSALTAPATASGFPWDIYINQFGIMSRAISYAIKSEAVTYAASPLFSDGTYTWADATKINGEALSQCLNHNYSLFNVQPTKNAAQNPYALYFITSSNDQRSVDKETIYQCGGTMAIWQNAGLPTNSGMSKSGPCPSQELVDSYEMANGKQITDAASGYDPTNPYVGRDPRFYASIYYNGAVRILNYVPDSTYAESPTTSYSGLTINTISSDINEYITTNGDPHMNLPALTTAITGFTSLTLSFDYKSTTGIIDPQIFFGVPGFSAAKSVMITPIPASSGWSHYSVDLTSSATSSGWGSVGNPLRFDLGGSSGKEIQIKNLGLRAITPPTTVKTYIGGAEGLSLTDRTHTRTGYYVRKFNNYLSSKSSNADGAIRLFRLGELYLNFAESAYQSNGPDVELSLGSGITMSARDAVNVIRKRAGMPDLPTGLGDAFGARYRNERRIELAFESHRFFDVRRWKVLSTTDQYVSGMQITKNGSTFSYSRFKFNDRNCISDKWLLYPIDQSEVNKMTGYTGVNWQNSGW